MEIFLFPCFYFFKSGSMDVNPRICMQSAVFNVDFQIFSSQSVSESWFNVENTITLHHAPKLTTFQQSLSNICFFFISLETCLWVFYIIVPINAAIICFLPAFTDVQFNVPSLSSHEMDPSLDVFAVTKFNIATITGCPNYSLRAHSQFFRCHYSPCSLWVPGISVVLLFSVWVT